MWFTYVRDENVSKNLKEVNVKNVWIRRGGQRGRGLVSLFKKAGRLGKSAAKLDIGKMLIKKGVDHLPGPYVKGTLKIKNKKLRALLNSEAAQGLVNSNGKRLSARFF